MGATAGLRLLPGGKADDILAAVKQHLTDSYPFQLDSVSIINGVLQPFRTLLGRQWALWQEPRQVSSHPAPRWAGHRGCL